MPRNGLISSVSCEPSPFVISKNNTPKSVPPLIAGLWVSMVMLLRRDGTGGSVGLVLPPFGRWDVVLTSGARTAPALLLAQHPEAEPALSTLGLSSLTQNSRGRAALQERTGTLLYPGGAPEAVPCTLCQHGDPQLLLTDSHQDPPCSWPHGSPCSLPLVATAPKSDFTLLWWVLNEGNTSPIPTFWEPNNSHHCWGVGACAAAAPPKCSANIICS